MRRAQQQQANVQQSMQTGTFSPDSRRQISVMPVIEKSPLLRNVMNRPAESDSTPNQTDRFKQAKSGSYVSSPWDSSRVHGAG